MSKLNDFGFSMEDDVEVPDHTEEIDKLKKENERLAQNLENMYKTIIHLLDNLKKDPNKSTIKWPNRVEVIDKLIEKLKGFRQ